MITARPRDFEKIPMLTDDENAALAVSAELASAFYSLPVLHPLDQPEFTTAIHVIQNMILSRAAYRQHKETA